MVTLWCTAHGNNFLFKILFISDIRSQRQECAESYNSIVPSRKHKIGLGGKNLTSNSFRPLLGSTHENTISNLAKQKLQTLEFSLLITPTVHCSCMGFEYVWPVPSASSHTSTCAWWQNYCSYFQPWPFTQTCFYTPMPLNHHYSLNIPITYLTTLHLQAH